ncbi:MAG TPA: winged helix-turn-helix domain-containing protein [Candidatus Aminicenantes bacterium]|nr:winged helix-turn-helix domain-containing protein [Candidatus Aminicenantes bacterium]
MLTPLLGSINKQRILIFLLAREEGYAREIARFFETDLYPIQRQLERLEQANILFSRALGKTVVYAFNPRYPFLAELKSLLAKALEFHPQPLREALLDNRRRPRRRGKPL